MNNAPTVCAYCKGTGREFAHACPVCGGTGANMALQADRHAMGFSPNSNGMGFMGNTGRNTANYAPESCGYCSGSGRDFCNACPSCRGSGSVMVGQPGRKCATCQGKGRQFAHMCPGCRGSGWACLMP